MPQAADPNREFAVSVVKRLQEAGHLALWAGGCVRDLLMGRDPKDYDVATDATPERVRDLFGKRRTLAVGESFGVIVVLGPKHEGATLQVEVATFRAEGAYLDGRRPDPQHIRFTTPEEDAWRRDFTINGMFYDPVHEHVRDYVGGEEDLRAGIVRAIGEPHDRMQEDKLRMLRAVRFAATLDFELDESTARAIREMAQQLRVVSPERIAQELRRMLAGRHRRRAVRLLQQLNLLTVIFPELEPLLQPKEPREWSHTLDLLEQLEDPGFELAAAALLRTVPCPAEESKRQAAESGTVRAICKRLKLSNHELDAISWLVRNRERLAAGSSLPLAELKRTLASPYGTDLRKLMRADAAATGGDRSAIEFVDRYVNETPPERIDPPPLVSGTDLIALGLTPGRVFHDLLEAVRVAQLNEEIETEADARTLLQRLIRERGAE
ncbi:MAG: CCA tRNA nucleotidyltransferase [Planctomycetota bacterium]|nr:MAG: CCA tRNA nucleotidyltransferase [Planctomycetota bacterium]REJ92535.1 MAG: CCA tRNA nucleotidyltransferase [Planctomycetota bacterium]REK24111.1 MAG: CCA tRNA nucleotidyltransferase [Planctomycetota bacterium]REK38311.1 MAG: CCA tRNA nucleotidyltransferase [Planctomycetota bacterium]